MSSTQVSQRPRFGLLHGDNTDGRVGEAERIASLALGSGLVIAGVANLVRGHPLRGLTLAAVGGALASRGVTGRCAAYKRLGVESDDASAESTPISRHVHVRHSVTIDADADKIYSRWRDLPSLPGILSHIKRIEVIDFTRSRWVAEGPLGAEIEWEARIVEDKPGRLIAWQSEPGSQVATEGRVEFRPAPGGRGTVMRVDLTYRPPGGALGAAAAKLLRADPDKEVPEDLRRFKQVVEAGEAASSGASRSPARMVPESERRAPQQRAVDPVEQASRESFPASDAPAW